MEQALRIVIVEDAESDAQLMQRELRRSEIPFTATRVTTEAAFRQALEDLRPDLILCDYGLPHYDAMAALRLTGEICPTTPFIVVTGSIDEETAVECMKAGATDYILKDRLARLGPAVKRALEARRARADKEHAEAALRESEQRYALAARGVNDGLWDWNLKTGEVYFSSRWKDLLGYQDQEIGNRPEEWLDRVHPSDQARLRKEIAAHLEGSLPHLESEYRIRHRDGSYRWMLSRALAVRDEEGGVHRMAGSQSDITRRKQAEDQLVHDAFHDALTGLPNRALFLDRLRQAVARAQRRSDYEFAVLFLDLDRFKVVNESLGHELGDRLLVEFARRLLAWVRPGDTVARFGGDEFTVLLEDIRSVDEAARVADRMQKKLRAPFVLDGREIFTTASIGIVTGGTDREQVEDLLRDADTAMFRAKTRGKARHQVFDAEMHAQAVSVLNLQNDLRRAVERGELRVHYQPIVSFHDSRIAAFEALVRWEHPTRGLLAPAEFVPMAEETGLIVPIGEWVLAEACRRLKEWHESLAGALPLMMSVNLSARQFSQPDLVDKVQEALRVSGVPPRSLRLELTESMIMEEPEAAAVQLRKLKELGVAIDVDDFGTGYSSLSHLRRFPIDALKIDRSFVSRMQEEEDLEIVRTIVTLAGNLRVEAIAEGVETREQMARLRGLACGYGQGHFFARPTEVDGVPLLMQQRFPM